MATIDYQNNETLDELGLKLQDRYPEKYKGRDPRSVGLAFYNEISKENPDFFTIGEFERGDTPDPSVDKFSALGDEDQSYFAGGSPYDPDASILSKLAATADNLDFSGAKLAGDVYEGATSPIQTAKGMYAAGAGGLEKLGQNIGLLDPSTPNLENQMAFDAVYQGLIESMEPKNLVERPFDAFSNLMFGGGIGLKAAKGGLKATRGLASSAGLSDTRPGAVGSYIYPADSGNLRYTRPLDAEGNPVPDENLSVKARFKLRKQELANKRAEEAFRSNDQKGSVGRFSLGLLKDARLPFPTSGQARVGSAFDKAEDVLDLGYKFTEKADPANILMKGAAKTISGAGKYGWGASKFASNEVKKALYDPVRDVVRAGAETASDMIFNIRAFQPLRTKLREANFSNNAKSLGFRSWQKLRGLGRGAADRIQSESEKTFGTRVSGKDLWRGILNNVFAFTWNKEPALVAQLFDYAQDATKVTPDGQNASQVMLNAIRQKDAIVAGNKRSGDAIVGRRVLKDVYDAVKKYTTQQDDIQTKLRNDLKLDQITVGVVDFRKGLLEQLKSQGIEVNPNIIDENLPLEQSYTFQPFFGESGQKSIIDLLRVINDPRFGNEAITLAGLDKFKQMIGDSRYDKAVSTNTKKALDTMYAYTREYIGKTADNPNTMRAAILNLDLPEAREWLAKEKQFLRKEQREATQNVTGKKPTTKEVDVSLSFIPQKYLREASEEALGKFAPELTGSEYSLAMRQWHDTVTFLENLQDEFKLRPEQTKQFIAREKQTGYEYEPRIIRDSEGNPVYEETQLRIGNDSEVLDSLGRMFGDPLAFEHFLELARMTDNKALVPQILGYNLRETIAGGLAPRGAVGAEVRGVADIGRPLAVVAAVAEFLPAVAMFSPKFGSQVMIRAFSPEMAELKSKFKTYWQSGQKEIVKYLKNNVPEDYNKWKNAVAEALDVNPEKVSITEVEQYFDEFYNMDNWLSNLPEEQYTIFKNIARSGRVLESGEQAIERRERNEEAKSNVLTNLSNLKPSPTGGGSTQPPSG